MQTPLFESDAAQWDKLYTKEIDTTRTIRYISLRFNDVAYEGLRLYDESKDFILDLTWHLSPKGEWSELEKIPEGQQIIGMRCNTFDETFGVIFYLEFVIGPVPGQGAAT